ncbi:MAG: Transcription termination factor Rho [Chlamydiia bacterium]|nr:Transcription termination factor Rho [Chlamydiia bacterium]
MHGPIRIPNDKDKYFALLFVEEINGLKPAEMTNRKSFVNFTPIHPTKRLMMETTKDNYSTRVIDLVSPIGKGQRALIVAQPKAGKTIILQNIIHSITVNEPKVKLLILLIDERPEEVTDMQRLIGDKGQVIASTFDEQPERHCLVAEMCIEKAKRLVEMGEDVVIILDSITRLARAYNTIQPHSGKILSGGVDAGAMHKPKRFFGAARNLEEGGSLTIIGSALVDTGSKMDEVIYEEFKGTGNLELVLDRRLSDRRLYPAIDVIKSGTRKEDLLYHEQELEKVYKLRAALADLSPADAMNLLLSRMKKTNNNTEFLLSM